MIKVYEVPCVVKAPHLYYNENESDDPDWGHYKKDNDQDNLFQSFKKYREIKTTINKLYYPEFLSNLREIATSKPNQYKNKNYVDVNEGDLIAIKESFKKTYFYSLGIIKQVIRNDLNEVVECKIKKQTMK